MFGVDLDRNALPAQQDTDLRHRKNSLEVAAMTDLFFAPTQTSPQNSSDFRDSKASVVSGINRGTQKRLYNLG